MANREFKLLCAYGLAVLAVVSAGPGRTQDLSGGLGRQPQKEEFGQIAQDQHAAGQAQPSRAPVAGGNPLWAIPLSALSSTRDRPLFSASRRPPQPPPQPEVVAVVPPPPPPAEPEKPPFTLVGTAVSQPRQVALVLDQASKALLRLHVGESAKGWVLRSVELRDMTMEKDSQSVTLAMPEPGATAGAMAGNQPPAVRDVALMHHRFNRQF
ncbi:MAG TPA: hypothetical protein VME69_09845 [Methylocella sp.]|nr:hypothetical protein [Methylocella sp.]